MIPKTSAHYPLRVSIACVLMVLVAIIGIRTASAINITVDYRYDTNNFFNTQQKRNALEAAAGRYSAIITSSLLATSLQNNTTDARIGFTHPGLGTSFEVSPATSSATDQLVTAAGAPAASEYRGPWSIATDEWILYAGGRSLATPTPGVGGTGTGLNFSSVFTSSTSHVNRGFRATGSPNNLPVWGGSISFDSDGGTNWHFDHTTMPPIGTVDLYSLALHEIGHALGLNSNWVDWISNVSGLQFFGANAVTALNHDNGFSVSSLNLVSVGNPHWQDGAYDSFIFLNAHPNLLGTVGTGTGQDLLMEPTANFTSTIRRFELTNVDVAALRDVGWSVVEQVPEPYSAVQALVATIMLGCFCSNLRRASMRT